MWWLEKHHVDVSDQEYGLDKVIAITFVSSHKGLIDTPVKVNISELTFHGRDWRYAWAFAVFLVFVWGCFLIWLFKS